MIGEPGERPQRYLLPLGLQTAHVFPTATLSTKKPSTLMIALLLLAPSLAFLLRRGRCQSSRYRIHRLAKCGGLLQMATE